MSQCLTRFSTRTLGLSCLLSAALSLAGCGASSLGTASAYPVKGQVILATGKPLTSGKVIFLPKEGSGMTAKGDIGADGTFSLKTADDREGAPAGVYKVRIEPDTGSLKKEGKSASPVLPFPAVYADEDGETGLVATVKAEPNHLEPFRLVPVAAAKSGRARDHD